MEGQWDVKHAIGRYLLGALFEASMPFTASERGASRAEKIALRNALFVGVPGLGKTEFATLVGKVMGAASLVPPPPPTVTDAYVRSRRTAEDRDDMKRLIDEIYKETSPVVVGRDTLVGEYVGHSESNTIHQIVAALGRVLIIDEAYELVQSDGDNYGQAVMTTLLRAMTDLGPALVLFMTGYEERIRKNLLDINPGLASRVTRTFRFQPYNSEDLARIFYRRLRDDEWGIQVSSADLISTFDGLLAREKLDGMARDVVTLASHVKQLWYTTNADAMEGNIKKGETPGAKKTPISRTITREMFDQSVKEFSEGTTEPLAAAFFASHGGLLCVP